MLVSHKISRNLVTAVVKRTPDVACFNRERVLGELEFERDSHSMLGAAYAEGLASSAAVRFSTTAEAAADAAARAVHITDGLVRTPMAMNLGSAGVRTGGAHRLRHWLPAPGAGREGGVIDFHVDHMARAPGAESEWPDHVPESGGQV